MEKLILDILDKSKNNYEEYDFKKLSKVQQQIILVLLSNFINKNNIVRYEEAYCALYDALTAKNSAMQSLIKSIENNIDSIFDYNLNHLFNIIINNRYNISDLEQLNMYKKDDSDLYENTTDTISNGINFLDGKIKKIDLILEHFFNISRNQALKILDKFGGNKKIVDKYKYFFDDLQKIINYSELPNSLSEVEQTLKSPKDFMENCNYYALFIKFKQEFGKEFANNLFSISDAVNLNQFQKRELQNIFCIKNINDDIIDDIYQIPFFANGNIQPFIMMLKGIRYTNNEYGNYANVSKNKKYNSTSIISNNMISLFANSSFYLGYNISANDIYSASTRDGGSDDEGFYPEFTPQCDEKYYNIDEFLFKTVRGMGNYFGSDSTSYSYNEIIINNMIPSYIVYIKKDDELKDFEKVVEARNRFIKNGIKIPIIILDMQECLKTQVSNIVSKCKNYLSQNDNKESLDDILKENVEIMKLYIQSLATICFMEIDNNIFDLKSKIEEQLGMNKKHKHH